MINKIIKYFKERKYRQAQKKYRELCDRIALEAELVNENKSRTRQYGYDYCNRGQY